MKLHLVVFTSEFESGRLCLDSAWSEAAVLAEPDVARRKARLALERPGVLTAGVAIVDVPEAVILPYLCTTPRISVPPTAQSRVDRIE